MVILFQLSDLKDEITNLKNNVVTIDGELKVLSDKTDQAINIPDTTPTAPMEEDIESQLQLQAQILEDKQIIDNIDSSMEAWNSSSGIRKVYLTFDDGPSYNTDRILDILNEYGVKATFFVVGKEGYTKEYQRIVEEGHTLGMHSYSHKFREIYKSVDSFGKDMDDIHTFLYEVTGTDCSLARFPGGSSNTISKVDMKELIAYLDREGIAYYDWNVSSGDASGTYISASQIVENVLNGVKRYDSAIVLMHDSPTKDTTVEALPIIIEKILESENTVLLPISGDTIPVQHVRLDK